MDCNLSGSSVHGDSPEYWSGLPCPPSGYLPNPGIEPKSPVLQAESLPAEQPGKMQYLRNKNMIKSRLNFHFSLSCIGEGNGNPLQCSCLENPRDRRAWWGAVYGVAQSQTRLKWLSSSSRARRLKAKSFDTSEYQVLIFLDKTYALCVNSILFAFMLTAYSNCKTHRSTP